MAITASCQNWIDAPWWLMQGNKWMNLTVSLQRLQSGGYPQQPGWHSGGKARRIDGALTVFLHLIIGQPSVFSSLKTHWELGPDISFLNFPATSVLRLLGHCHLSLPLSCQLWCIILYCITMYRVKHTEIKLVIKVFFALLYHYTVNVNSILMARE